MPRWLSAMCYWLYRIWFRVALFFSTMLFANLAILLTFFDRSGNASHYSGVAWSRVNLFCGAIGVDIDGQQHLVPGQPYIVMSNHQSHLDVCALIGYLPLQLRWVMKIELRRIPIFGFCCARMGHIYVDRRDSEKSRKSLENAGVRIRGGASVVFFPEGTRSSDGKLLPFKKGGFHVALASRVPILPVTISGGLQLLPKGTSKLKPGRLKISLHEPIPTQGYSTENMEELITKVRGVLERGLV